MNAVEIEEAVSRLAGAPFDPEDLLALLRPHHPQLYARRRTERDWPYRRLGERLRLVLFPDGAVGESAG